MLKESPFGDALNTEEASSKVVRGLSSNYGVLAKRNPDL